jgi:hypothetical protein
MLSYVFVLDDIYEMSMVFLRIFGFLLGIVLIKKAGKIPALQVFIKNER